MRVWLPPVMLTVLLCALSAGMPALEPLFEWVQPDKQNVIYERESFLFLLQNHLMLVVISALVGTVAAVAGESSPRARLGGTFCRWLARLPLSARPSRRWRFLPWRCRFSGLVRRRFWWR